MGVPITFLDHYSPEQFSILNANDYRRNDTIPCKAHGLIKDAEGTVCSYTGHVEREREQNGLRSNLHQTYLRPELTDGISTANVTMHASSYDDMVARPICGDRETYRRIFLKSKS